MYSLQDIFTSAKTEIQVQFKFRKHAMLCDVGIPGMISSIKQRSKDLVYLAGIMHALKDVISFMKELIWRRMYTNYSLLACSDVMPFQFGLAIQKYFD